MQESIWRASCLENISRAQKYGQIPALLALNVYNLSFLNGEITLLEEKNSSE
jgi:hypothetical protein